MIVLYDEECILCVRFKQAIELIDGGKKITFRSIYDEKIYKEFPDLTFEACEEEIHMLEDDIVHRGSEVIERLIQELPGVKKFAWLIDKESGRSAMRAFYGQINEMRNMQKRKCFRCGPKSKRKQLDGDL
jgi:predicted DCC family thiol-disulfide oxidoreductase YuxK